MTPQSLLASPTGLSPYLRFGCLSTRLFYHELTGAFVRYDIFSQIWMIAYLIFTDLYKKLKNACPPLSFHGRFNISVQQFIYD